MVGQPLALVRRWAVDWLNSHDPAVLPDILADGYVLRIGGVELAGLDAYREATIAALRQFPGLVLTVHDILSDGDRAAVRFTEHGASLRHECRVAAWRGIALFRGDGERLTQTYAEEDYAARRRQLGDGQPDPLEPPHVAPWDVTMQDSDGAAERTVRTWLDEGTLWASGCHVDDRAPEDGPDRLMEVDRTEVDELFSAGPRVAFHVTQHGRRHNDGATAVLRSAGLVEVIDGIVVGGHVVRDRLGLLRPPTVAAS